MTAFQTSREAVLLWFSEFQKNCIIRDGVIPEWFHGIISRKTAEEMLMSKPAGHFLIRVSESRIGYSLSYRAEDRCRHFMIDMLPGNNYEIVGEEMQFNSLYDLVAFHRSAPIHPYVELLTVACGQASKDHVDYADLLFHKKQVIPPESNARPSVPAPTAPRTQSNLPNDVPPALPARPHPPPVPSPNPSLVPAETPGDTARLYPCLETELGDSNLLNLGPPPVPKPRIKHTETPPQIPSRATSPPGQTHASAGAPTERPLPSPGLQSDDKRSKHKTQTETKPRISLAQCRKIFQKKRNQSEEHTYTEINDKHMEKDSAFMKTHQGNDYEHQELRADVPNPNPNPNVYREPSGTVDGTLPIEYLNPPPFAPGYQQ